MMSNAPTLNELLNSRPTILIDTVILDTTEHSNNLIARITDMYWNWQINGDDIIDFSNILYHKVARYAPYYCELINAYEVKINMLDGNKVESTLTSLNDSTDYDLPRSSTNEEHPSSKTKDNARSTSIVKGGNQVALKEQYMRMIRDIYSKFAKDLQSCFIELWS